MNMISTGAFLNEMDASNKQETISGKFVSAWEKKNAKAARAGGVSLMALSLAACGSSSSDSSSSSGGSTPATTPTAQTLTLTSGVDTVAGGSGDDTINAGLDSSGNQTLTALDNISGGAGTDTMNVVLKANATPASTGVESYVVSASAAATLDMLGSTGVTSITNKASTNTLTVNNISGDVALTLSSTDQGGTFNFDTAGAKAAQTVNVSSVTGGTLTVGTTGEVTLNSQGAANTVTLSSSATSLKVTGSEDLTLSGTTAQTTIDASGATGKFTVTSDNTKAVTITGSEGADTVTMTGSNALTDTVNLGGGNDKVTFTDKLANADVVEGGDGIDTLVGDADEIAALTTTTTTSNITGFEVIQVATQVAAADDFDVSDVQEDGITTVTLAHASTATDGTEDLLDNTTTITGEAGSLTVNLGKSLAGNVSEIGATLTLTDGENTATDDSVTINNTGINSTSGANVNMNASLTSTGYENVTLNTGGGSGNTEQSIGTITVTADAATAATTLTLKGNNAIDVGTQVTTNSTAGITVDGSGLKAQDAGTTTMDLDTVAAGSGATVTITGSDGDDIFGETSGAVNTTLATTVNAGAGADAIYTGTGADTINAGAGNDTIDSGTGNDTIDGGAGNDTIDLAGNFTKDDTVVGGDGVDTLLLNNTDATTLNAYSLGQINTMNAKNSGIEKVTFANGLAQTIDMSRIDGVSTVQLGTVSSGGLAGLAASNEVIYTVSAGAAHSLALADGTGTADELNITVKATGAVNANTVTANKVETINIKSVDADSTDASAQNTIVISSDTATSIVVTGKDGLDFNSSSSTANLVTLFDASGVVAENSSDLAANMAVSFTSTNTSNTAVVTVLGGEGNDVLEGRSNGPDVVSGGKGADQITYTGGNDTISGGAGNDTIKITDALLEANSASSNTSTFDGGAGTDTLQVTVDTVAIVDADMDGMTSIETLTLKDGANSATLGAKADAAGIATINGGTGVDTIDLSDSDFDNAVTIDAGAGADVVTGGSGKVTYAFSALGDSTLVNDANALDDDDTFTISAGDEFDFVGTDIAVVYSGVSAYAGVVGTNSGNAIGFLDTAFKANDDGTDNVEAMIISFTGGEQFFVVDAAGAGNGTIANGDLIIQLAGDTLTGLTLTTDGDVIVA